MNELTLECLKSLRKYLPLSPREGVFFDLRSTCPSSSRTLASRRSDWSELTIIDFIKADYLIISWSLFHYFKVLIGDSHVSFLWSYPLKYFARKCQTLWPLEWVRQIKMNFKSAFDNFDALWLSKLESPCQEFGSFMKLWSLRVTYLNLKLICFQDQLNHKRYQIDLVHTFYRS